MALENVISIYKIDTENPSFEECNSFDEIIEKIIKRGNDKNVIKRKRKKEVELNDYKFIPIKHVEDYGFNIKLYHAERRRPNSWNAFLRRILESDDIILWNHDHDFIVFVYDSEFIFCFTGGVASNLVCDVCDENFPKELMIRLSDPRKIKQAKSRGLTGAFYARELYFRGDYNISPTEAFGSVWKDIRASVRDEIQNDSDWQIIIGDKVNRKINCDIKSSFKIRKRVSFELAIKLIYKLKELYKRKLSSDEEKGFYFLDTIKIIKNKDQRSKLNNQLIEAAYVFLKNHKNGKVFDYDFCHKKYTEFLEADRYIIKRGANELCNLEEINNAEQILNLLKAKINLSSLNDFKNDFTSKINVTSEHDEDESRNTKGSILDHLHGEIEYNGKTYFLIDKEWCLIEDAFLEVLSKEFNDYVEKGDSVCKIPLLKWSSGGEGDFNEQHLKLNNFLVADRITLLGIELFDILHFDEKNLYIIQVKDGLGASTRDACSQLRNSAKLIEESIKSNDHEKLKDFYKKLNSGGVDYSKQQDFKNQINSIGSESNFLDLFLNKNRVYVLAFKSGDNIDDILKTRSNIAKFEILGLKDNIKMFNSTFKLFQIEK